jgi:hypothetical protein
MMPTRQADTMPDDPRAILNAAGVDLDDLGPGRTLAIVADCASCGLRSRTCRVAYSDPDCEDWMSEESAAAWVASWPAETKSSVRLSSWNPYYLGEADVTWDGGDD